MNKQFASFLGWYFLIPLVFVVHRLQELLCACLEFLDEAEDGVHETLRELGWQVEEM